MNVFRQTFKMLSVKDYTYIPLFQSIIESKLSEFSVDGSTPFHYTTACKQNFNCYGVYFALYYLQNAAEYHSRSAMNSQTD